MKPDPNINVNDIIQGFRDQLRTQGGPIRRHQPRHEGDPFDRAPDAQELEEVAHLQELMLTKGDDMFRTLCIACEQDLPIREAAMCVCGGFVCPDCRESEEEGVCNHEPPDPDAI